MIFCTRRFEGFSAFILGRNIVWTCRRAQLEGLGATIRVNAPTSVAELKRPLPGSTKRAGLADFLFLSRTGYISYASGGDLLMATLPALVVGGVSLAGGIGAPSTRSRVCCCSLR